MGTISQLDVHKLKGSEFWSQKTFFFFQIFNMSNNAHSVGLEIAIVHPQINYSKKQSGTGCACAVIGGQCKASVGRIL